MTERYVPPGSPVVLVVDDEYAIRLSLVQVLRRGGYDAKAAADPHEADGLLARGVDALLVDLHLPVMRGDAFFHYAVAQYPHLRARTVFMTGDITEAVDRIVAPTGCPVLAKPFEKVELLTTLERMLARRDGATASSPAAF